MLILYFVAVCVQDLSAFSLLFCTKRSATPLSRSTFPSFFPPFHLPLFFSWGHLDYVAKEIFFLLSLFAFFPLFSIDLVLMHFQCPLVCAGGARGGHVSAVLTLTRGILLWRGRREGAAQREPLKWKIRWFLPSMGAGSPRRTHALTYTNRVARWPPTPLVSSILSSETLTGGLAKTAIHLARASGNTLETCQLDHQTPRCKTEEWNALKLT